ncbi:hypothetical protein [Leifsonia sp. ALI-44-B]|uniref:hypothetical protein n=1 Tax=Leifsonia sp. ALI-44-B TaxID=1933776 RepID=UPI00117B345B|nr:hypothetical protein [Leifsonia sp. ALI-44-B]
MAYALPATLGPDVLPRPELRALVLDGELWPLDRTFHAVDEPDRPGLRADALFRALLLDLSRRRGSQPQRYARSRMAAPPAEAPPFVAGGLSAAWVHGAILAPPRVHEVLARAPARVPVPPLAEDWLVAQAHVREDDVCLRGGWPVLTELATGVAIAKTLVGAGDPDDAARNHGRSHPRERDAVAIRTAALTAILVLAGLDTVDTYLAGARPRRGTRAHEAITLIGRILSNLRSDNLFAAQREAARVVERADECANECTEPDVRDDFVSPRPGAENVSYRDATEAAPDALRTGLTEQKRSTPLHDPRMNAPEEARESTF